MIVAAPVEVPALVAWTIVAAAFVSAMSVLAAKVLGPFIARPIARVVKEELADFVQEIVTPEMAVIAAMCGKNTEAIEDVRKDVHALARKLREHSHPTGGAP